MESREGASLDGAPKVNRRTIFTGIAAVAAAGQAKANPDMRGQVERNAQALLDSMKELHGEEFRLCMDGEAKMVMVLSD